MSQKRRTRNRARVKFRNVIASIERRIKAWVSGGTSVFDSSKKFFYCIEHPGGKKLNLVIWAESEESLLSGQERRWLLSIVCEKARGLGLVLEELIASCYGVFYSFRWKPVTP